MTRRSRLAERVFRGLLRWYPPNFRRLYGEDTFDLLCDRLAEARAGGWGRGMAFWVRTVPHLIAHGLLERWTEARRGRRSAGAPVLRSAWRSIVRAPGLSLAIVLTLALGIGANVALFGVLRSVLLRPLPFPDADRLVQLWETNPALESPRQNPSPWNFVDWERSATSFDHMAVWFLTSGTYRADGWVEEVRSAQVSGDFFRTLGVRPLIGRDFGPDDVGRAGALMLSHGAWQRLFGGDPAVIGKTMVASGTSREIVGVMPPDFSFPDESVEIWMAWNLPIAYEGNLVARTWRFLGAVGRLRDDVSMESATAELQTISAGLAEAWPEMNRGWSAEVTSLHEDTVGDVRGTLWIAFGSVLVILLIACANVANLLLARLPNRLRAVGIRATLGATRADIAREAVVENLILAGAAGGIGLGLGALFIRALVALDAGRIPRLAEVSLDPMVFAFTALVVLATGLLFGVAPLVHLMRDAFATPGRAGARPGGVRSTGIGAHRAIHEGFVGSQIALAVVLLTGAGLFTESLDRLTQVDPGIDTEGVAAFRVSMDPVAGDPDATTRYYQGLLTALEAVPGVESVAASQTLALDPIGNDFRRPYRPSGSPLEPADAPAVQMRIIAGRYAETMGMTVVEGEPLPSGIRADEPLVALVNETLARDLWPGGGAVGQTFEIDFRAGWQPYRVVGVVGDVRHYGVREDVAPEAFLSHVQSPYLAMHLIVKAGDRAEAMFAPLRDAVFAYSPGQPPHNFVSLERLLAESTAEERFLSVLLIVFAGVGLLLATTGVYGVIAYSVSHRRGEIGMRLALGARAPDVVRAVMKRALRMAAIGVVVGLGVVVLAGGLVGSLLYDVSPLDPITTGAVALTLVAVAALAAWLPARKVSGIAPAEALRTKGR